MSKSTALPVPTHSAPVQVLDQHEQEHLALINTFIVTVRRFFGGFIKLFRSIHDPRHPSFTVYPFSERHCPYCLTRTRNGKTTYYHPVLEAKLVTPNGFAFSIMTEFIENPGENPTKQDWITNFNVKRPNVITLANEGGRLRWKIENEGFNVQKNGGYRLEHAYTRNATASKVFYYLLQIAHIIAQLMERGSLFRKAFPAGG